MKCFRSLSLGPVLLGFQSEYARSRAVPVRGYDGLVASVAQLRTRLDAARNSGTCLLAIGWGAGLLSKSSAIAAPDADTRPFPTTRRIVFLKNKPATLAGWVELRVQA